MADVRMRDAAVGGRRMGLQGFDIVDVPWLSRAASFGRCRLIWNGPSSISSNSIGSVVTLNVWVLGSYS